MEGILNNLVIQEDKEREIRFVNINNIKCIVKKDKNYKEYIALPDLDKGVVFQDTLKNAIRYLKDTGGDIINEEDAFKSTYKIYYYLDREYGEKIRQLSLSYFKNKIVKNIIEISITNKKNSNKYVYVLMQNNSIKSAITCNSGYLTFDTEIEANRYINTINKKFKKILCDYKRIIKFNNPKKLEKFITKIKKSYKDEIFIYLLDSIINKNSYSIFTKEI